MQLSSLIWACMLFASTTWATALTYKLAANERYCFFAAAPDKGVKIAFYFAVGARLSQVPAR